MQRNLCSLTLLFIISLFSCAPSYMRSINNQPVVKNAIFPFYDDLRNWAAHPLKEDPSDSIPTEISSSGTGDSSADVFFIHPTTFTNSTDTGWNGSIDNDTLNAKTDFSTILYQASAFNQYRLFAPRYRQAHLRSYYTIDTLRAKKAFDLAYEDIRAAFENYLLNNKERPIILAAHSQGSTHALRLLKDYFQSGSLRERLVVAYIIGMYIPSLGNLSLCKDSIATGCVCAWRTFRSGYIPDHVDKESGPAFVTNPLTWNTENTKASRMQNKGSVIRDFNKVYKFAADAKIENHVLWVSQLRFPGSIFVRQKNFHIGDINLFYMNIRENVNTRVRAYYKK